MLLTTAIKELRDTLADPAISAAGKKIWEDAELIRHLSRQVRGLFRRQSSVDAAYHNCDIHLIPANFRQIGQGVYDYATPPWCERVTNLWYRDEAATEDENPHRALNAAGTTDMASRGAPLPVSDMHLENFGWRFHSLHGIRIVGIGDTQAFVAQVAKTPGPLTRGTIDKAHAFNTRFYLVAGPGTEANGLHDYVTDSYRNATFQFESASDSSTILTGVVRKCVGSRVVIASATRYIEIQLDSALPRVLAIGDTYEMHLELPESASRYAILLAARAAMEKKHMIDGIKSILPELKEQEEEWLRFIAPRQVQEPSFKRTGVSSTRQSLPADAMDRSFYFQ